MIRQPEKICLEKDRRNYLEEKGGKEKGLDTCERQSNKGSERDAVKIPKNESCEG